MGSALGPHCKRALGYTDKLLSNDINTGCLFYFHFMDDIFAVVGSKKQRFSNFLIMYTNLSFTTDLET